jgi:hypothetical protein
VFSRDGEDALAGGFVGGVVGVVCGFIRQALVAQTPVPP